MKTNNPVVLGGSGPGEKGAKIAFAEKLRSTPIPDSELLDNLGVYMTRQNLSRLMFMSALYEAIVPVHGIIVEFGVRWGQNLSLWTNLRGILEPYNYNRRIIGFDTFGGFPEGSVSSEDTTEGSELSAGDYGVSDDWKKHLEEVLQYHEANAPIAHKTKFQLIEGDASQTLQTFLDAHPETIIALAYFDFDLYVPTKKAIEQIWPYLTKGSVVAFDELNTPEFPGETIALRESVGLSAFSIRRLPYNPLTSYFVIE